MTSEQLKRPSLAELEDLYQSKGKDALVWYAWRNALRALPLLGKAPVKSIWGDNAVKHVYAVCRVALVLAQYKESESLAFHTAAAADAAADHAHAHAHAHAAYAAATAYAAHAADAAAHAASAHAASAHAASAHASDAAAYAASHASAYAATHAAADHAAAAACDYSWLRKTAKIIAHNWLTRPLFNVEAPTDWLKYKVAFLGNMRQMNLGFLADDLESVLNGKPLGAHAGNYFENLSETITNDPVALRNAILGQADIEQNHAVRILLVGPGGAGKSSLADRLQQKAIQPQRDATDGICMHELTDFKAHFPDETSVLKTEASLDLHLWDFGGQTIFHGLHKAFLHENCVYVLVVDSRHEQAPDAWLHQINATAGGNAALLIVTNLYENCDAKQNQTRLKREFGDRLQFFNFSCQSVNKSDVSFSNFIKALVQAAEKSKTSLFKSTVSVISSLREKFQHTHFIPQEELDDLVVNESSDLGVDKTRQDLMDLGFIVKATIDGNPGFCFDPAWTVSCAYQIINAMVVRDKNGLVNIAEIKSIPTLHEQRDDDIRHLLRFLKANQTCCEFDLDNDESRYFFPDASPENDAEIVDELFRKSQDNKIELRFDLSYLPVGLHSRLVHGFFNPNARTKIEEIVHVWRHGFVLKQGGAQAEVHYLIRKDSIAVTLFGELKDFTKLLIDFHAELIKALGNQSIDIQPVLVDDGKILSLFDNKQLIDFVGSIGSLGEYFEKVREMSNKINIKNSIVGDGNQYADGENINQIQNAENISLNSDQQALLSEVLKHLGDKASIIEHKELSEATDKFVTIIDAEENTKEEKGVIGAVWNRLQSVADFSDTIGNLNAAKEFVDKQLFVIAPIVTEAIRPLLN